MEEREFRVTEKHKGFKKLKRSLIPNDWNVEMERCQRMMFGMNVLYFHWYREARPVEYRGI